MQRIAQNLNKKWAHVSIAWIAITIAAAWFSFNQLKFLQRLNKQYLHPSLTLLPSS